MRDVIHIVAQGLKRHDREHIQHVPLGVTRRNHMLQIRLRHPPAMGRTDSTSARSSLSLWSDNGLCSRKAKSTSSGIGTICATVEWAPML